MTQRKLTDKYRRLRILYNRVMVFGDHPFYSYWASHVFNTAQGQRKFVCSLPFVNTPDEIMDFYYEDENGNYLFEIEINKQTYKFKGWKMNEEQAWLAIHELEELSYKELEKYYEKITANRGSVTLTYVLKKNNIGELKMITISEFLKNELSEIINNKEKEKAIYGVIVSILEYLDLSEMSKCDREYISELLKGLKKIQEN